jgi:hypothetical protein
MRVKLITIFLLLISLSGFVLAQETDPNLKVAFIADQGVNPNAVSVLNLIQTEGADLIIISGDLGYSEQNPNIPYAWDQQITNILGPDYPIFASQGNHDVSLWENYSEVLQQRLSLIPEANCIGDLGIQSTCNYRGLQMIMVAPYLNTSYNHTNYIKDQLAQDNSTWSVCSWHLNQKNMQIGNQPDYTGWGVYEECKKGGAIIATAHEHSYHRTHLLSNMETQTVADNTSPYTISNGETIAFVSGLGGSSIRNQERCLPSTYPYGCNGEWASIYTTNQNANFGALFCDFNVDLQPDKSNCYFKDINNNIIDSFTLFRNLNSTTPLPPTPQCSDGIDNDSDGFIDYPADPGCSSVLDNDETDPITPPIPSGEEGLVALYHFDGNTLDSSGNAINGIMMGNPLFIPGYINDGIDLDGVGDGILISEGLVDTEVPNGISGTAWFKITPPSMGASNIIVKGYKHFALEEGNGNVGCRIRGNTGIILTSKINLNDGLWHHGACVLDTNLDTFSFYLDGSLFDIVNLPGFTGLSGSDSSPWGIGFRGQLLDQEFHGSIDEVKIYNRSLSSQEVLDTYNGVSIPICGNGIIDPEETCDDGNTITETCPYGSQVSCQVCDSTCQTVPGQTTYCGDTILDPTNGEVCDSDSQSCTVEGFSGTSSCLPTCTGYDLCVSVAYCTGIGL